MAGKKQLPSVRAVADDEKALPQSLSEAARSGSRLDELKAMRRVLAAHIDHENTLARDLAPLMRQVREISKEIEELEAIEAERAKDAEVKDGNISTIWNSEAI
ncbi:hypothetical protein QDX25_05030 [Auritidibacter ignavus]|uniref:hypothetical protein n=1 Tax=Auritidibacter ignavus TaxID=678932 RepID=UPI00244A0C71|nr:hypothetical protein [Auritidibacter ignavus]WGH82517.1 hypothetical protein QDX25_05030 [Auritidibacter ignavus]